MVNRSNVKIPTWVNVFQAVLIAIMLQQVHMFLFDHEAVAASGIWVDGTSPNFNLLYEFASKNGDHGTHIYRGIDNTEPQIFFGYSVYEFP